MKMIVPRVNILIVDENPDFAKSMGVLIQDVLGNSSASVEYAYNIQDGLVSANQSIFHFIFFRDSMNNGDVAGTKDLYKQKSQNPSVEIITLTFNGDISLNKPAANFQNLCMTANGEIDAYDLASFFEKMK